MKPRDLLQISGVARSLFISGLLGGNLAAVAMLRHPRKAIGYIQYSLFGWRMMNHYGLPMRHLHELLSVPEFISLDLLATDSSYIASWDATYAKDMMHLALLAKVLSPKMVFEIGTYRGSSALTFALNTPADSIIYTLDLPHDKPTSSLATTVLDDSHIQSHTRMSEYLYERHPAGVKVKPLYGDSAKFDFTPYQGKIDLFFIDGAHSYEYVRSDTMKALPCLAPGGVLAWHDYGRWGVNGVSRWLHEFNRGGKAIYRLAGSSLAILKAGEQ